MSCIWKNTSNDVKYKDVNCYDVVDKAYDVSAWHNVAAEMAAEHPNPLERHLVNSQFNFSLKLFLK